MRKLLRSKKALSPVVAAIILIAVTVAVSIAVAAWMGSLTFTFMETEQATYTQVVFNTTGTGNDQIVCTTQNTGSADMVIIQARVSGYGVDETVDIDPDVQILAGDSSDITIDLASSTWTAGKAYTIELLSSKGNKFSYTETA
jgi:flagellin-like protein